MSIETKVTSLELSKKLRELKITNEAGYSSEFYWISYNEHSEKDNLQLGYTDYKLISKQELMNTLKEDIHDYFAAFLAEELFSSLPKEEVLEISFRAKHKNKLGEQFEEGVYVYSKLAGGKLFEADTLVNAMALMVIYLAKNNLIKLCKKNKNI